VDKIYAKMMQDLSELNQLYVGAGQQIEIMFACSTAGGTGAGTLIDAAWLLRKAASQINLENYVIRAFIILPTAFEPAGPIVDKRLRTYCFWRELDRFMLSSLAVQGNTKIVFNPNSNPPLEVNCDRPLFDNTYMVDPKRDVNPINHLLPEQGVFPAVSHMMSFILDDFSGHTFAAHYPNVAVGGAVQLPPGVYHSSFGCYTVKVPVFQARDRLSRELACASLEKLTQPALTNTGEAVDVRRDRNRETAGSVGAATKEFLIAGGQGTVTSTAFFSHIETVHTKTSAGANELLSYAKNEATAITNRSGETFQAFINRIPPINEDDHFIEGGGPLQGLRSEHVWHKCKRSRDRDRISPSENLPDLISGTAALEERWFGRKEFREDPQDKRRKIEVRVTEGEKTGTLNEVGKRQLTVYNALLREWINAQLNGYSADAILSKSGKIGYTLGALENLILKFENYLGFIHDVRQEINQQKFLQNRLDAFQKSEKRFREIAGKTSFITFWDNNVDPRARDSEDYYLERVDTLYNVYLAEQVLNAAEKTINNLMEVSRRSASEIKVWIRVLVIGKNENDPSRNYKGMYNSLWETVKLSQNILENEIDQGNVIFQQQRQFGGVQQIIKPEIAQQHYQNNDRLDQLRQQPPVIQDYMDDNEIRNILAAIKWEVEPNPIGGVLVKCGLIDGQGAFTPFSNGETDKQINRNLDAWRIKSQIPFININQNHRLDLDIEQVLPSPSQLADMIKGWVEPMYHKVVQPTGVFDQTLFVRVDSSDNQPYFQSFVNRLKDIGNGLWTHVNPGLQAGQHNSEDPFKMSVVLGHHLMPSSDFQLLDELEDLFIQNIIIRDRAANPIQHFNFTAEKNALEYALKRPMILRVNYAPFGPMIASILEDKRKISLFCWGFAQGIIKRVPTPQNQQFNWVVGTGNNQVHLFDAVNWQVNSPSIFDIVRLWIIGKDCRQGVGNIYTVDFANIEEQIYNNELASTAKVIQQYRDASDELIPGSLIKVASEDLEIQQALAQGLANGQFFEPALYTDIKDLFKIILLDRVNSIQ
jgi:hypothetical protein